MAWLITGLRHEAIRLAKKHKRQQEHELLILNTQVNPDVENNASEKLDFIAAKNDTSSEVEEVIFLQDALSLLTPQQQKVITAIVLEGRTEQEVAEQLRIAQPVTHRLKKRALQRLRKYFIPDKPTNK